MSKNYIFFLQKWSIFVKNGNFMSKIVIFFSIINTKTCHFLSNNNKKKLVISGQFNSLKWSIFVKNGNFMSKGGNSLSKITKIVIFCQKK